MTDAGPDTSMSVTVSRFYWWELEVEQEMTVLVEAAIFFIVASRQEYKAEFMELILDF